LSAFDASNAKPGFMPSPVLLVGGSGFVGRSITARLMARGYPVIIPTRRRVDQAPALQTPQVRWVEGSVHEPQFLEILLRQVGASGTVINLVGVLHDKPGNPYGPQFKAAHVDLVELIIKSMQALGIRRLLHMSALGADCAGPSMYQRSKGEGERLVRASALDWTIFRPSVIFGAQDNFINLFSKLARRFPILPLARADARFQPVRVDNVAEAMVRALALPQTLRQSYDLAGPEILTLAQLVRFAARRAGHDRPIVSLPTWLGNLQALLFEHLPGPLLMSRDNLDAMRLDNVLPVGAPQVLDSIFGIHPEPLDSLLK
jgi:NADH dehydrogenase